MTKNQAIERLVAFLNDRIDQCVYLAKSGHILNAARKRSGLDKAGIQELLEREFSDIREEYVS